VRAKQESLPIEFLALRKHFSKRKKLVLKMLSTLLVLLLKVVSFVVVVQRLLEFSTFLTMLRLITKSKLLVLVSSVVLLKSHFVRSLTMLGLSLQLLLIV
jgi:hypothetical protein